MKLLALDFSASLRSIALFDTEKGVSLRSATDAPRPGRRPGSPFALLKLLGDFAPEEIEGIAIGLGPGSYTGIRSALAIAQGWNLARGVSAVGISSAEVIALTAMLSGVEGDIEVVIDAQRSELYSQCFHLKGGEMAVTSSLEILKAPRTARIVGPEATRWNSTGIIIQPGAPALAKLAAPQRFGPPERLEPIYLREPSFVKAPAVRHP